MTRLRWWLLVGWLILVVSVPLFAHDRDDDDRDSLCRCACQCPADAPVVCNCSATTGPYTCGRLRARECKALGLRPGCRRCIPTVAR